MGGERVLRLEVRSSAELREALRIGLPYRSVHKVADSLGYTEAQVAKIAGIAVRTLARRRKEKLLKPVESDRLFRIARVIARATDALGSEEKARRWLTKPNQALGGERPVELLDTEVGELEVEALLGRIEHGIMS